MTKRTGRIRRQDGQNNNNFLHGMSNTPEHVAWQQMIWRCSNSKLKDWPRYGGRGIKVCERWVQSFSNFLADMGLRPSAGHSVDRFPDKDGNYEPANCRWATPKEQANNRRSNRIVCYHGCLMSLTSAVRLSTNGVTRGTAARRLKLGWTVEAALDTPCTRKLGQPYERDSALVALFESGVF